MPPLTIDLKNTEDPSDAVHLAVEFLAAGKLVALPSESVYGVAASALSESGINRLCQLASENDQFPFSLAVKSGEDAFDYVPELSLVGQRLSRRCWPGPLTLVLDCSHPDSLLTQMPRAVQRSISVDGRLGLRVPDHPYFHKITRLTIGPMVFVTGCLTGAAACTGGGPLVEQLGDQVDLILDDGPTRYGQPSTLVQVEGNRYEILREGVLGDSALKRMSSFLALMVCTGNTCRSPMAEVIFKKHLADKVDCDIEQLEDKGVIVASAGVAAMPGAKASDESVEVVKKLGLDLSQHESQPVSDQLLESADLILTMTNGHRQALVTHWPEIADRTHVISVDGGDISDPIGGPMEVYETCARQIDENLKKWASKTELGTTE